MQNKTRDNQRNKSALRAYAKYSGLAFQMIGIILLGTFCGFQLDKYTSFAFPLFTLLGVISSVILSIYFAIKDLLKK